jgi:hypothetical protein
MEEPTPVEPTRPIELGWILIGDLSPLQREAVHSARRSVSKTLATLFPEFHWEMPLIQQPSVEITKLDEPAARLHEGVQERDHRSWDFALVITPRDLASYYKSYALAVPSRALAVAVLSLARLAPAGDAVLGEMLERRVIALALHLFGDLNGLWHREEADAVMRAPQAVTDLDRERSFDPGELEVLRRALVEVADLRLEEASSPPQAWRFYLRASRERAREIASAVLQARPWEFPFRLSRFTAAAFSALLLLLVTAEVWDLGTSQRGVTIAALSCLVVSGATSFILARQKLLMRRAQGRLSEQAVVMNVSATLIVLLGMLTTYAALFGLTVLVGLTLFGPDLIARWAPAVPGDETLRSVLVMAGLVSSLGLLIGSLGASFEGQNYFRHVIYADEET